jgi:hypothetical protein
MLERCDICDTGDMLGWECVTVCKGCASKLKELSTTAPNTGKLPTLEECLRESVVVNSGVEYYRISSDAVRSCYDFICRQLRASA